MGRIGCLIDTGLSEASQKTWEFSVFSAEISLFRAFPFSGFPFSGWPEPSFPV